MTAKHTPGTWYYDKSLSAVVVVNQHKVVAVADFGKCAINECDANAALIASAPDLLAALEMLVNVCTHPNSTKQEMRLIAGDARAAIAKAGGES